MTATEQRRQTVLIVEHDAGVRALLARLVSKWGARPLLAESEAGGIHLLEERVDVALVLSDFQPDPDGATVHDHLVRRTSSPVPPVVCTLPSARAAPEDVELVQRPFDTTALRRIVDRYVHGSGGGHRPARPTD